MLQSLQQTGGNRAVGSLLQRHTVQRAVGWPGSTGWNKGKRTIDTAHKLVRIPLADLAKENKQKAPNPEKTDEDADARAIVWIHPDLKPADPVQVLVHLHGLTYRDVDPFPGWRETNADPTTSETQPGKDAHDLEVRKWEAAVRRAKRARPPQAPPGPPAPWVNPLGGKVRDVERDRIGQQVEATRTRNSWPCSRRAAGSAVPMPSAPASTPRPSSTRCSCA